MFDNGYTMKDLERHMKTEREQRQRIMDRENAVADAVDNGRLSYQIQLFSRKERWSFELYDVKVLEGRTLVVLDKSTGIHVRVHGDRNWSDVSMVVWRTYKDPWESGGVRHEGEWVEFKFPE